MSENRTPPNLLYLTIYNPSLRPTGPIAEDNEDAEEQAHILFYTSKERAVSRDRLLRQIGLAKALINFSEMFNPEDPCDNVHSQTRRMIMVSPEPDFWIHAGIEIGKVLRTPVAKGKGKGKEKPKANEKGKEKDLGPVYDYEDGSLHDIRLRADILRGYERFKLLHGSFTSILSALGQEALELQLERFFTVWAWSWDIDGDDDFGEHLGIPLHPASSSLIPILDEFASHLSDEVTPLMLSPPHPIPSTRFMNSRYPSSLIRHLMKMIPPPTEPPPNSLSLSSSADTIKGKRPQDLGHRPNDTGQSTFLGMPAVNMNMGKWNWPGYLTFGKNSGKSSATASTSGDEKKPATSEDKSGLPSVEVIVDRNALEDAMSSENRQGAPPPSTDNHSAEEEETDKSVSSANGNLMDSSSVKEEGANDIIPSVSSSSSDEPNGQPAEELALSDSEPSMPSRSPSPPLEDAALPPEDPLPQFLITGVHLASPGEELNTKRTKIYYLVKDQIMLALIGLSTNDSENLIDPQLEIAATRAFSLFIDVESAAHNHAVQQLSESLPSATKILQPTDRHVISIGKFTIPSPGYSSKSSHLYNAKALENLDPMISEVFSRGQNPQHWYIAKRGLNSSDERSEKDGEVYMEVFKKEASLADVDNELAGVVRKANIVDGSV